MTNTPKVLRCRWVQRVQVYLAIIPGSSEQVKCTIFSLRTFCRLWYGLFQASWCWESEERMWHRSGDRHKGWRCHALQRECSGQRGAARPCWQQQERNLYCSAPPCLCSENRSMCWFSGARITSRGAEAKAVHSAGSKQDSTRCPSCSHKWHWQISLKGLKGVCKRWGRHSSAWIYEHLGVPFCTKWIHLRYWVACPKMWPMSLENCFTCLKLLFRLLKPKNDPFEGLVLYYSHVYMF